MFLTDTLSPRDFTLNREDVFVLFIAQLFRQLLDHRYRGAADELIVKGVGFPFPFQGSGEYVYGCTRRAVLGSHSERLVSDTGL